jgi:hypothetical protein
LKFFSILGRENVNLIDPGLSPSFFLGARDRDSTVGQRGGAADNDALMMHDWEKAGSNQKPAVFDPIRSVHDKDIDSGSSNVGSSGQ